MSNLFNRGSLRSSHYAAGIVPFLPQTSIIVKSFYVATDSIIAPNASAFVNYNSTTATLSNGYLDGSRINGLPLVGEDVGTVENLFIVDTKTLQSDSLAYVLDIANFSDNFYRGSFYDSRYHQAHWSRVSDYPIFADSTCKPIYQVEFVSHKTCSALGCELDTNRRYTNYKGFIASFPKLLDGGVWTSGSSAHFKKAEITADYEFSWSDSLIVAMYFNCNDLASTDLGCCMNYIFDINKEYTEAVNSYNDLYYQKNGNINPYHFPSDSVVMGYCQDDDGDGLLSWDDPTSAFYTSFNSMKNNTTAFKESYEKLLSSSDTLTSIESPKRNFLPKVFAKGKSIQVENVHHQKRIVILDAQGRVVKNMTAPSSSFEIPLSYAGRYFVKVGMSITAITIK